MTALQTTDQKSPFTDPEERERMLQELWEKKGREAYREALLRRSVDQLSEKDPSDIQGIAAEQIQLLNQYYNLALDQARKSFRSAQIAAAIGLGFFLLAVSVLLFAQPRTIAVVSVIGGALVEAISGIQFYLYGKASERLADFQGRLDRTQRFLLANSVCSALEGEIRDTTRSELVGAIAGAPCWEVKTTSARTEGSQDVGEWNNAKM